VTANTWFQVKGSKVKVTAYVTANTDSRQMCLVSLLIYRVSASCIRPPRARALRMVGGSAPHGGCQAHFTKHPKTIFLNQTNRKNLERLAWCRSAFEMQCFRNCTLSIVIDKKTGCRVARLFSVQCCYRHLRYVDHAQHQMAPLSDCTQVVLSRLAIITRFSRCDLSLFLHSLLVTHIRSSFWKT